MFLVQMKDDRPTQLEMNINYWLCIYNKLSTLMCRSNHLNGPDFDALETVSVTSCSSAYSSKSDSSLTSPPIGSTTEFSDAGSCETYQEYDIKSHKVNLPMVAQTVVVVF